MDRNKVKKNIRPEVEEERDIIAQAGELPEVAFYESFFFLTTSAEGPGLKLWPEEIVFLKEGVIEGYKRIILRDLNPQNRAKEIFRGIERAVVNFKRLKKFAQKEGLEISHLLPEIANALRQYVRAEINDQELVAKGIRTINCDRQNWDWFCQELGLEPTSLIPDTETFFKRHPFSFKETINFFKHRQRD
jgi:hypothetical protein